MKSPISVSCWYARPIILYGTCHNTSPAQCHRNLLRSVTCSKKKPQSCGKRGGWEWQERRLGVFTIICTAHGMPSSTINTCASGLAVSGLLRGDQHTFSDLLHSRSTCNHFSMWHLSPSIGTTASPVSSTQCNSSAAAHTEPIQVSARCQLNGHGGIAGHPLGSRTHLSRTGPSD